MGDRAMRQLVSRHMGAIGGSICGTRGIHFITVGKRGGRRVRLEEALSRAAPPNAAACSPAYVRRRLEAFAQASSPVHPSSCNDYQTGRNQ